MNMGDEYPYLYDNSEQVRLHRHPDSIKMAIDYHILRSPEVIQPLPSNDSISTYTRCDTLRDELLDRLEYSTYKYRDIPTLARCWIHARLPSECFVHNLTKEADQWLTKAEIRDDKILRVNDLSL